MTTSGPIGGQGGADYIPTTYTYGTASFQWQPADADRPYEQGQWLARCVYSQVFYPLQVVGPSTEYVRQQTLYGVVGIRVTTANVGMRKAPAYIQVVFNGVQYTIQVGASATVPTIVKDLINDTGTYVAT